MKNLFVPGDKKQLSFLVGEADLARFQTGLVHPFYSTFSLGRDAEWTTRQFVLEMKEEHEEGIGTFLEITHLGPAMLGETVTITGVLDEVNGNNVICSFLAEVGNRPVARGRTGQKILRREKLEEIIHRISHG